METTSASQQIQVLKKLKEYLITSLRRESEESKLPSERREAFIQQKMVELYQNTKLQLPDEVKEQLFNQVLNEVAGYGPIQRLLNDPEVSEIMVNGPEHVYVERKGKIVKTDVRFEDDRHVLRLIERIVRPLGRSVDSRHPTVDARLPDGSRVNAVIPPVAVDGPAITIRKFGRDKLTVERLIELGSIAPAMAEFLQACVVARLNILIAGGTGSGKTTLLNILSGFIPSDERIVTIEDAAELQLRQEHIVRMETKPPEEDGKGMVTTRDLVRNSLRMRPDRIIIGEVRGGEALDMLQAMNTGHDGCLTTLHANSPREALSRLETMSLMSDLNLPVRVIREQIASAVDLVVQQSRLSDGTRKVTQITEVLGMEGDTVVLSDLFKFEQTKVDETGKVIGEYKPTGLRPLFMGRLEMAGFKLKPEVFGADVASILASNRNPNGRKR